MATEPPAAEVLCAHVGVLGADAKPCSNADAAVSDGPWTLSGDYPDVLADLRAGISIGGALLRLADRDWSGQSVLLADGRNLVVLVGDATVWGKPGPAGTWTVTTLKPDEDGWQPFSAWTLTHLDECGPTTMPARRPASDA